MIYTSLENKIIGNALELTGNKYGRHNDVPQFKDIISRRDYLTYRLAAIQHNQFILLKTVERMSQAYDSLENGDWERIEIIHRAINQSSFCFDDVIFNLASFLDYFGNYLGLFIFGPNDQTLKWNGFVNKCCSESAGDIGLFNTVKDENKNWFDRIHSYRGDVIHRKAIRCQVEGFVDERIAPQEVHDFKIIANSSLKKHFYILRGIKNEELVHCSNEIISRTCSGIFKILEETENYIFDEKHHFQYNNKA